MPSLTVNYVTDRQNEIVSYWKLGNQITGGRWYHIFRAAPKIVSSSQGYGYVLKTVNPLLSGVQREQAIDRLGREAWATERIVHPNVVRVLDAELDFAPFFLVQPWIEGKSFDRYLATAQSISLNRMLWAIRQIAEALKATHEAGRVHLGLDPSHVILGRTGKVTLLGWSQSYGESEPVWLPHDQVQLASFSAPESFESGYQANPASDVYSLGAFIYLCFAMGSPFLGHSIDETRQLHRHHIPTDLQFAQSLCPVELSRLVKEMLLKNARHRPTMGEVLNRLISIEIEHLVDYRMIPV
jgi:serine/threonine protein kinase